MVRPAARAGSRWAFSLTPPDLKNVVAAAGVRYPEDALVPIRQLSRPAMSHPS
jgi:hypothetical protein